MSNQLKCLVNPRNNLVLAIFYSYDINNKLLMGVSTRDVETESCRWRLVSASIDVNNVD